MKLYIDTSNSEKIVVGLEGKKVVRAARQEKAQKLLQVIDYELSEIGKTVNDISSIDINTGPGSFTGLRVGVSVANTLGWSLGIPVNGEKILRGKGAEPKYLK